MEEVIQSSVEDVHLEEKKIDEKIKAEEALRRERERLEIVTKNIGAGLVIISKDYHVLWANKVLKDIRDDVEGKVCYSTFHQRTSVCPKCGVKEIFETGKNQVVHQQLAQGFGGQKNWIELTATPIRDENGNITAALELGVPIDERKKAEDKLKESEEKYRNLFENARDIIVTSDLKGNVQFVNKATEELTGYTSGNGAQLNVRKITPLRYWPKSLAMLLKAREGKPIPYFESMIRRKDGRLVPVESGGQAIFKDGKVVGVQIITRDISERKIAEEKVRESEEKYKNLFESARDVIVTFDLKGNVTSINKAAAEYGFKIDEIIGKNMHKFASKKYWPKMLTDLAKTAQGKFVEGEIEIITPIGKKIVEYRSNPIREGEKVVGLQTILRDVAERKKMEEKLKSLARFPSENPNPVLRLSREGIILYANDAGKTLLRDWGCEAVDRAPKFWRDIVVETLNNQSGKSVDIKLGKQVYSIFVTPVVDAGYANIYGTDITERKRVEEELRKSEGKYRTLLENVPQKIFLKDRNSVYVSCNENYARDLKIKSNEITGKTDYDFYPKELAEKYRADDKRIMEFKETQDIEEEYIQNGQRVYVHTIKTPVKDENGNVVGVLGIFWDVTERRLMEQKYSIIIKTALDGFWINDRKGRLIAVNDAYCRMIGYTREELLSMSISDIEASEKPEETAEHIKKVMKEGYDRFETCQRRKDLTVIDVEASVDYYPAGGGQFVVFIRDITERKNMQKQLKEYSEHLEEKVEERTNQLKKAQEQLLNTEKLATIGEITTMVGHDLRNPLQSIENAIYFLRTECASKGCPISQKAQGMLQVIDNSVDYADKIVRDLQDFSVTNKPIPEKTDINAIVDETLSQVQTPTNVELRKELSHLPEIMVDKNQMKRIFLNLITNAIQAMENGGTLTISTSKTNGFLQVSFKDTGVGITEETMDKLFSPFYTTKAKGMGMGLPICKKFVEIQGGSIKVESEIGKGSTFTIKLPIRQENGGGNH